MVLEKKPFNLCSINIPYVFLVRFKIYNHNHVIDLILLLVSNGQ